MKDTAINPSEQKEDKIEPYHVESAARDLMQAEVHKANPKLMKMVHKHLGKQHKAIKSIQQLKEVANAAMTETPDEENAEAANEATPASRKAKAQKA